MKERTGHRQTLGYHAFSVKLFFLFIVCICKMDMQTIETVTILSGFCWGVSNSKSLNTNFLESPLMNTLDCAITGTLYSMGALVVSQWLPQHFKIVLPSVCLAATLLLGYKTISNLKTSSSRIQND